MIYVMKSSLGYVKIGITSKDTKRRVREIQTGHPGELEIVKTWELGNIELERQAERRLHKQLAKYKVSGEWFSLPLEGRTWLYFVDSDYLRLGCSKEKDFSKPDHFEEYPIRRKDIEEILEFLSYDMQCHWEYCNLPHSDEDATWLDDEQSNTLEKWCDRMLEAVYYDLESDTEGYYSLGPPTRDLLFQVDL